MKRFLTIVLTLIILTSLCLSVSADEITGHTYEFEGKTVIFESDTPFSAAERQHIAEHLVYGGNEVSAYGFNILCLFGHNYDIGYVTTITHCVNSTQPRCFEEEFRVGECTRCGTTYTERINYNYITCCP